MDEGRRADGAYEFGDFRLLAAQRTLTARSDGRPIELTQKAFDTLRYLVEHPGELLDNANQKKHKKKKRESRTKETN